MRIIIFILFLIKVLCVSGHGVKSSLTFVIDDTSSMGKDIAQVKSKTNEVFEAVLTSNASMIDEFVLVTFNDPDAELRTITDDRDVFKKALAGINVHGGGDCPEMAMKGVELALEHSKPNSFFYIFTDASASDHSRYEYIKSIGQKKSIQITFLLTGICDSTNDPGYKVYHEMAAATSGQVFHMKKDDVCKILDYVIEAIKSKKTPLGCKTFPGGYGKHLSFTVDSKISDVIISVSGFVPKLSVTGPQGVKPETKELVNIGASLVTKIIATPGVYTITAGSIRDTSVLITGSTTVCFQHGFSAIQPASINETSTMPIPGGKSYLSIALTNDERDVKLETVEIRDMNDKVIMTKTLQLSDEHQQFYVTEPFDPPNVMCKIAVNGKINGVEAITRVGSTSIEPQKLSASDQISNKPPTVYLLNDHIISLEVNDTLVLKCRISGYPKPDIIWESNEGIEHSSKVSQVEIPYDYMSVLEILKVTKNTTYRCKAINFLDSDEASVDVIAKERIFFNVIEVPKDSTISYKNNEDIKCEIDASPPVIITWYKNNVKVITNPNLDTSSDGSILTIKNMVPELAGKYSCKAANTYEDMTFEFILSMTEIAPLVNIEGDPDVIVEFDSSLTLTCEVTGYPKPTIIWEDESGFELAGKVSSTVSDTSVYINTLNIVNVNQNKTYTCKAANVVGSNSKTVSVKAKENRFFNVIEFPKDVTIDYLGSKDIICIINASPPASITWYRDKVKITTGQNLDISQNAQILKIINMEPEFIGKYSCKASNNYESSTFEFIVAMTEFAPTVDILGDMEINVKMDSPVTLTCEVSGYPKPNIIWEDGSGVKLPGQNAPEVFTEKFVNTLEIANVNQNTTYTCMATNIIGTAEKSVDVNAKENRFFNVIESPKAPTVDILGDMEINVKMDSPVTLTCEVSGYPKPNIIWEDGSGVKLPGQNAPEVFTEKFVNTLEIANVNQNTTYTCMATNIIGTAEKSVDVNAKENRFFNVIESPKDESVAYHDSKEIKCIVDALPPATFSWYKDTTKLLIDSNFVTSSDGSILKIQSMEPEFEGNYSCEASNNYDAKTFNFQVKISEVVPSVEIIGDTDVNVTFDDPLTLTCKVIGYPKPHVIWKDEFGTEVHSDLSLLDSTDDYIISVLTIDKVNTNATYYCTATNAEGVDKKPVNIKTKENKFFNVLQVPQDETIAYQGSKDITCKIDALPPATITWFQDNQQISTGIDFDVLLDGSTLKIKSMKPNLIGNYSCNANSSYDSKIFKFEIMISGVAPTVEIEEGNEVNAEYNEPLSLNCKVSGYPKPHIIWQNVLGIEETSVLSLLDSTDDYVRSVLTIAKVNANATYYCIASNPDGIDKKPVHVKTEEIIYFNVIEVPQGGTIAYKASKEIKCKINALPTAKIFWYMNKKKVIRNNNLNISPDGSIMKIKSMRPEFAGKYYCEAVNKYERKTFDFDIKISGAEKPKINKKVTAYKVQKGSDVNLDCRIIQGKPKPSITWQFKRSAFAKFQNLGVTGENIKIYSAKVTDIGTYRCKAHNDIGDDDHNLDLFVEYPPTVEIDETHLIIESGERVKLACRVDGSPIPDVQWLKDGIKITNGNKYRIFRHNTLSFTGTIHETGKYTCKASNTFQDVEKSIRVEIYIPVTIEPPLITSLVLEVGGSSKLFCKADGYPKPVIQWTYYSYPPAVLTESFTPESHPEKLVFDGIQIDEEGFYTCTASNIGGALNITYSVNVTAPPSIVNKLGDKKLKAVDGDLVLKIPCEAIGGPKPKITWMKNGLQIHSDTAEYDIEKSGTLVIKNPDVRSAASYTCEAKNNKGSVSETFEVEVLPYPIAVEPMETILLTEAETRDVECKLPHNQGDSIRWFKDNRLIKTGELRLVNIMTTDRGIYSCRISNYNSSHSFHVKISIGIKPTFLTQEDKYIDFVNGTFAIMECGAVGDPIPKVVWTHEGRRINVTSMTHWFFMGVYDIGSFQCNVSNDVGFIIRSFEIKTGECSLNIEKDFSGNQPLLLSHTNRWPIFEKSNGYIKIPQHKYITLYCPGTTFSIPGLEREEYVSATCITNSTLHIKGKHIDFSNIKCQKQILPFFFATGMPCGVGTTELIHVGYSLKSGFLGVFDTCFDKKNHITLFTRHSIDRTAAEVISINEPTYSINQYNMPFNFEDFYDCSQQINEFSSVLMKPFHVNDGCCFTKRKLVNPRDVLPGLQQVATYNYLNVMPQWSTCNTENWDDIERRIRSIVMPLDYKIIIWTGTSNTATVNDQTTDKKLYLSDRTNHQQPIPRFLWKVIQNMEMQAAVAIIQVNLPDLTVAQAENEILCKDICDQIDWLQNGQWRDVSRGFIYCCEIISFENAFNYKLRFRGTSRVLKQIPNISQP